MSLRPLTTILALAVLCGPGMARPFTNTGGRTIEAEITGATKKTVTLRPAGKRTASIPLATLSEDDQYRILAAQEAEFSVPVSGRTNIPFRMIVNEYYDSSTTRSRSGFK